MKRREFIRKAILAGAALQFPHIWVKKAKADDELFKITLLQTNDTHSRIDPFPMDGGRNQGLGGVARRATLVNHIRQENPHTILVDAGDVLQGTPYFNFYKGKLEYLTMSKCGYLASTLGNHEFDNGVDALSEALKYTNFAIVNCNFNFENIPLASQVKRYIVQQLGPIRVGITGIGIDFLDLVALSNHTGVSYKDPVKPLQTVINHLREDLNCQLIVVLSHLGYRYWDEKISDLILAHEVDGIDWLVGGHTHTFMKKPEQVTSRNGHLTRILQVGWAGIILGKTDFYFQRQKLVSVLTDVMRVDSKISENLTVTDFLG
jgi:5'-nucleotidase